MFIRKGYSEQTTLGGCEESVDLGRIIKRLLANVGKSIIICHTFLRPPVIRTRIDGEYFTKKFVKE